MSQSIALPSLNTTALTPPPCARIAVVRLPVWTVIPIRSMTLRRIAAGLLVELLVHEDRPGLDTCTSWPCCSSP